MRAHNIDVRGRVPVGARVLAIRVPESDVDAGELLVLKNLSDYMSQLDIGADGELADQVAVLVGVRVGPEFLLQLFVVAADFGDAVLLHFNCQRLTGQVLVLLAQIITDDAVDDANSVNFAGGGEDLATGKIAPLVAA